MTRPGGATLEEAGAMLRLSSELHAAPPDPVVRKKVLLAGLCRLVAAETAMTVVTYLNESTGQRKMISAAYAEAPAAAPAAASSASQGAAARPAREGARRPGALAARSECSPSCDLESIIPLAGLRLVALLTVSRHGPLARRFAPRQRALVGLVHSQMAWVYDHDLLLISPRVLALPLRQRETLQYLVAGDSEKQIAVKLHLSPGTVHQHVNALYRHFAVSSRGELLARWAQQSSVAPDPS